MMGLERRAGLRRFLAAALSLVLIVASVIGVRSHAGHNEHHLSGGSSIDFPLAHAAGGLAEDQVLVADAELGGAAGHDHSTCTDMVCHGGFAILAVASGVASFDRQAVCWLWSDQTACRASTLTLDRPPKALVLA